MGKINRLPVWPQVLHNPAVVCYAQVVRIDRQCSHRVRQRKIRNYDCWCRLLSQTHPSEQTLQETNEHTKLVTAVNRAYEGVAHIHFDQAHYRRDIGR